MSSGNFEEYPKPALRMWTPYQEWPYTYEGLCATLEIFHEIKVLAGLLHAQHLTKVYKRFHEVYDIDISKAQHISCWTDEEEFFRIERALWMV